MAKEKKIRLPETITLDKEITLADGKKVKFVKKTRFKGKRPGKIALHEAQHAAVDPRKVNAMALYYGGPILGATFYSGGFDPVLAAAPAACGSEGCAGDHMDTVLRGFNWGEKQREARVALHGKSELIHLIASALEENGSLGRGDIQELNTIFEKGYEVEMVVMSESGKELGTVTGSRIKGEKMTLASAMKKFDMGLLREEELPREPANESAEIFRQAA